MKAHKLIVALIILSSMSICTYPKERFYMHNKAKIKLEKKRRYERQLQQRERKASICTPDMIKTSGKLGAALINATAIMITSIIKAIINK